MTNSHHSGFTENAIVHHGVLPETLLYQVREVPDASGGIQRAQMTFDRGGEVADGNRLGEEFAPSDHPSPFVHLVVKGGPQKAGAVGFDQKRLFRVGARQGSASP